jgi:hypothetical protein
MMMMMMIFHVCTIIRCYKHTLVIITDNDSFIQIQARTQSTLDDGWGLRSDVVTHVTADGQPQPPLDLRWTYRNSSSILIAWDRPNQENGLIIKYKVNTWCVVIMIGYSMFCITSVFVYKKCLSYKPINCFMKSEKKLNL